MNTRYRATVKEIFADEKVIYFDAMEQTNIKEISGYSDRKHKSKVKAVNRKYILQTDVCTGLKDSSGTSIYNNDVLVFTDIIEGKETEVKRLVFWRNGSFGVDISYNQGEKVHVDLLSTFLNSEKGIKVKGILEKEGVHCG